MPPDRFLEHFASLLDVILSPRREPWTSIWASLCPVSPPVAPDRFLDHFGSNLETSLKAKIEKRITRDGIWDGAGAVWQDFVGALKTREPERGIFQKCLFYIWNLTVCKGCGIHIGVSEVKKKTMDFDPESISFVC